MRLKDAILQACKKYRISTPSSLKKPYESDYNRYKDKLIARRNKPTALTGPREILDDESLHHALVREFISVSLPDRSRLSGNPDPTP